MNTKFPKSFYFKLTFIILVLLFGYIKNQAFIQATMSNESMNFNDSVTSILKEVMNLPQESEPTELDPSLISIYSEPGNQTPYLIEDEVTSSPNFKTAQEISDKFNESLDEYALNDAFLKQVNHMRVSKGWDAIEIGRYLEAGVEARAQELGQYHYISSLSAEGLDFRSQFPSIESAQYRLGENLYELYISAGDIHISTWQNTTIFADYLFDVFQEEISLSNYDVYKSQYISVHAEPTDYNVNESPYIRLVVTLVMDAQESEE